ncbi:MAG: hypothetical protein ACOCZ8_03470, partial [Bacteroidota bacterium]
MTTSRLLSLILLTLLLVGCNEDPTPDETMARVLTDHEQLSDYGFFAGELKQQMPAADVHPYELNTELFSDYAYKARFVYVPEGAVGEYHDTEVMQLP